MKRICTVMLLLVSLAANTGAEEIRFQSEEITFKSMGGVSLSGSLTLPKGKGPYPAIVLLGGSERLGRRAIYNWANADTFVSEGIAVFSFDSPGTGESEGNRWGRTHQERTADALAAIRALQKREDINGDSIGLYGASEGGSIVFRVTSHSQDIAFGITISAPAVPHYQVMNLLIRTLSAHTGLEGDQLEKLVTFNLLVSDLLQNRRTLDYGELEKKVAAWNDPGWSQLISLVQNKTDRDREATIESVITLAQKWEGEKWFRGNRLLREFYKQTTEKLGIDLADYGIEINGPDTAKSHVELASAVTTKILGADASRNEDPVSYLKQIKCPMLCIYGEKDQGIPASESAEIIRNVFTDNKHDDFVVKTIPNADHQLKITEGKRTFRHRDVDQSILDWVQQRVRKY